MKTYYSSTFLDESRTYPDKRGVSRPTGKLTGMVMARSFYQTGKSIKASRMVIPFSWNEDTDESKAEALKKVIKGMEELPELDENPPLNWVPEQVKKALSSVTPTH